MTRARIYSQTGISTGNVSGGTANITLASLSPFLTTANVIELTNLYFSNVRVSSALSNISINALLDVDTSAALNGKALVYNSSTSTWVADNPFFAYTTDSLSEGNVNLYYSNALARRAFTAGNPTITIDWATGTISANISAITGSANTTDAIPEGFNNLYYTNARVDYQIEKAIGELGNLTYTQFASRADIANTVLTISNFTTANLREASGNLYFTPERVETALANISISVLNDVAIYGNLYSNQVLTWDGSVWRNANVVIDNLTTANLNEGTNLYFTNARVNTAVQPFLTTANVRETSANLYFTNARVNAVVQPFLTTANVVERTNQYFTNVRVLQAVNPLLTTANVVETTNQYFTNTRAIVAVTPVLTTANVTELTNQYFTNTRVLLATATNDVTVGGNLTVSGSVTTLNVDNVQIRSKTITIAKDSATPAAADGSGIFINGANASLTFDQINDSIDINKNIIISGNLLPSVSGVFNVGSRTKKFLSMYLGTQTLFLGNLSLSESPSGGLEVKTASGAPSDGAFANLSATESITLSRVYGNVFPLVELKGYVGGNVDQFVTNETGNLYFGIRKDGDWNKFAGIRVVETRTSQKPTTNTYVWSVINNFASDYTFSGYSSGNDIPITINAGDTITFNVNAVGHPFWIKTAQVSGTGSPASNVINNGTAVGNVTWYTTGITPGTYYYVCENHVAMSGTITILADTQPAGNVRSDVLIYNDNEVTNNSIARIAVLGDGNVNILANIYLDLSSKFYGNVKGDLIGNVTGTVSTLFNHSTDSLREGSNLYYTNSRVRSALSNSTGVYYNSSTGEFSIGQDVATTSDVTFRDITVLGNIYVQGNASYINSNTLIINDPLIQFGYGNPGDSYDLGFVGHYNTGGTERHAGFFRDHTDGKFKLFDNLTVEPGINDIDTGNVTFRYASIVASTFEGNVLGTVSSLSNHTTSNLAEGTNQYFTNARVLQAFTPLLTTSNVTEGTELYYTNSRVISAVAPLLTAANITNFVSTVNAIVQPFLTTANVKEVAGNLYFTNARVISALIAGQNIIIEANGRISANASISISTTADLPEASSNLYFTNARVITAVTPLLTTSNVVEGTNQYFTNVRVLQAVNPLLTTANVVETTNQYFTNVRVLQAVNPLLTTSNVIEGTNQYFTNARVLANVEQMSINVFADVDITGIQNAGILQWNGTKFVSGTVSAAATSNNALFAFLADYANVSGSANIANTVLTLNNFTTANLAEGINLYYTNARVISAINPLLTTANVIETTNQYFTNARAAIALTGQDVSLKDLYVAGNLRVLGDTTYLNVATLDIEDKNITIANAATSQAEADGAGITIRGADATLTYKVVGDKFEVNKNFTVNGAITANTWTGLYTSNVIENTNQFFTNTRVLQAVTPLLTTSNVAEGSNLYFTTARVFANVEQMSINVLADVDITGITNGGYLEWNGTKFIPGSLVNKLTTANVLELTNLYFTNARAVAAIQNVDATLGNLRTTGLLTVSSSNQVESVSGIEFANNPAGGTGDSAKLQFYAINFGVNDDTVFELSTSNNPGDSINFKTAGGGVGINRDRPTADFDVNGNVLVERNLIIDGTTFGQTAQFNSLRGNSLVINGQVIISSDGNLANITVSKITANTWGGLYTANVIESDGYLYFTNARLQPFLTTANVTELTNQYFTNVRVLQAVDPLLTTANIVETTNQYFTNARVFANVEQMSVNVFTDVDITGIQNNGTLIWNGTKFVAGVSNSERANVANTVLSLSNFTTSDLQEGSNLYFTSTRTVNTVTPLLTTGNVTETTNQYFTNARVLANVEQMSINVFADVDITGIANEGILQWNGTKFVSGSIAQSQSSNTSLFAFVANVANTVLTLSNFTTTNLVEGSNLYYNDSRVYSNVANILPQYTGQLQAGNITTLNKISYANTAQVVKVYQYYNEATNSLDTIFL